MPCQACCQFQRPAAPNLLGCSYVLFQQRLALNEYTNVNGAIA